jgi:c-di-GMP-binding flagellar brake protein YcgR
MPEAKLFMEKRMYPRVSVKLPINYRVMEDEAELHNIEEWRKTNKDAQSVDLSLGGMFIAVDRSLPMGTLLRFDVTIPKQADPLAIFAEVVWSNVTGAGLRFLMVKPQDLDALKKFLESEPPQ